MGVDQHHPALDLEDAAIGHQRIIRRPHILADTLVAPEPVADEVGADR